MRYLILQFIFFLAFDSFSQNLIPVTWHYAFVKTGKGEGELIFKAKIQNNWHIYSQHQSGDGPIPTSFNFVPGSNYKLVSSVSEPDPEKSYSEAFETEVLMFSREVEFKQKISFESNSTFTVNGELEFMSCNDVSCLPPRIEKFSFSITP